MIGEKLADRYEVVSELGRGGMGVVYLAHDPLLEREVAIKVVAPAMLTEETSQRFQTEARLVAQMDHPSIVSIYDFGNHEGSLFFVMPLVEGDSLRDLMRQHSMSLGTVIDIGIEIAEALAYSHERGVVHRDIKPENVMAYVSAAGSVRLRIMDFGLARGADIASMTKTGMLVGTLSYISPEQVSGGIIDGRTDIYALGCVLYECVVSEVPFGGEMQAVLYRVVHETPQPPRSLGATVDPELEAIILSCLKKSPGDRPQSGDELATALRRYRSSVKDSEQLQPIMPTATMVAPRPSLSPFVGREEVFAELQQSLNAAIRGECHFVVVSGEPGVGKSRLLEELETLAVVRSMRVLHGRFVEESGAFPYHGFCEVIQDYFRQLETASRPLELPDLSGVAGDLVALFPMLAEIEAIRSAAGDSAQTPREGQPHLLDNRTEVFEILARALTLLSGREPLVLMLEDLHGAEVSIEALKYIVRRLGPTPTLIVASYRSTEVDQKHPLTEMLDGFDGDRRFAAVHLQPFSPDEHRAFVDSLNAGGGISGGLAQRLYETTGGNPFFTKELMRSLLDAGSIERDKTGSWSLSGGLEIASDVLPATIQQAVKRRLSGLPEKRRRILSVAAVMGTSFEFSDLEALAGDDIDIDDAVERFIEEGLLEEDRQSRGDRLTFSSAVVREVLYGELSRRKRRRMHKSFAAQLERRSAGRLERVSPQLVHHYYEGDEPEKTVEFGLMHAQRALSSFSPEDAIRSCRIALEFLDDEWEGDPTLEAEARLTLSRAYLMAGNIKEGLEEAEAAITVLERRGEVERAAGALLAAAESAWQNRRVEAARAWAERGVLAARTSGSDHVLGPLLSLAATLASLRGEHQRARDLLSESVALGASPDIEPTVEVPAGGTLVAALANSVPSMSPAGVRIVEGIEVLSNVFETLIVTDQEGRLLPGLCAGWEVLDDGARVRLRLRSGVTFSDGHPLAAVDVKRSFENAVRSLDGELPQVFAALRGASALASGDVEELDGIVVIGTHELDLELAEPLPIYPALLTDYRGAIIRQLADDGPLVGTGPFLVAGRETDRVTLERSPDYWAGKPALLDRLEFRTLRGSAAIAKGFRSGEIDLARDLLPEDLEAVLQDPRFRRSLVEVPQKITYYVLFNATSGPSARQAELRAALSGVVRASDLVWRTLGRFAQPATCLVPPGVLGHDPGRRSRVIGVEGARELLQQGGGAETVRLTAAIHPLIRDRYGSLLDALFEAWAEIGITVEPRDCDMEQFLELFQPNDEIDLLITRWLIDYEDPDCMTHGLFHSSAGVHRGYFSSPEADEILEAARAESTPTARQTLYRKFERLLTDASCLVPLFHDIGYRVANPKVKGLRLSNVAPFVNYAEVGKVETATGEIAAASGGVIRIPMSSVVLNVDASRMGHREDGMVRSCIFESLVADLGFGRIEPWLAEDYQVEDGGRRYRFRLRSPVHFHDGRRLTARDVRYSFELALRRSRGHSRWFYFPVVGAEEILDGRADELAGITIHSLTELSIELQEPTSYFLALMASSDLTVFPEGTERFGNSWRDGAVGTGPFRVANLEPGRRLELEPNPYYWRPGYPKSQGLEFVFGMPSKEILAGYRSARFSVASDLFPADAVALRRDPELGRNYRDTPALVTYMVALNTRRGPLVDRNLRKKILSSVDVEGIVERTVGSIAQVASGLIPPGLLGHDPARRVRPPVAVGKLDAELELRVLVHPIFAGEYSRFKQALFAALHDIGVIVTPVEVGTDDFVELARKGDADVFLGRWNADYADADTFAYILNSHDGFIGQFCGSDEIDRLIESGRVVTDPDARHAIYRGIEEILARQAVLLPLFHEQFYCFARPEVDGLAVTYNGNLKTAELRIRGR